MPDLEPQKRHRTTLNPNTADAAQDFFPGFLPESEILDFLEKNHIMVLCTSTGNSPYCASVFYALDRFSGQLIFHSDPESRHGREMRRNPVVAAAIHLDERKPQLIKGVQLTGRITFIDPAEISYSPMRQLYQKAFPEIALSDDIALWSLQPDFIKMTDNSVHFGYKRIWRAKKR